MKNLAACLCVLIPLCIFVIRVDATTTESRVDQLHKSAIVIDAHSDFLDRSAIDKSELDDDVPGAQTTLSKLEAGQVDAQFFSVFVPPAYESYGFVARTHELIDRMLQQINKHPERIELAVNADDIERLSAEGKIAALLGIEGGHSIENRLEHLRNYYRLGVRYMTLTWSNSNDWADSSGGSERWGGLNDFGVKVVKEMNRIGMMIDISHVSDQTFWDVMEHTTRPVIASHSSVRGEMNSDRNMDDDMIRAVAKNGGVIQINFYSQYLDQRFKDEFNKAMEGSEDQFKKLGETFLHDPIQLDIEQWSLEKKIETRVQPPDMQRVVDHIEYVIKLVGVDYVGLGSDYDGMGAPPKGLEDISKIKSITRELVKRGYSDVDIGKVLGGNMLRVMRANQTK